MTNPLLDQVHIECANFPCSWSGSERELVPAPATLPESSGPQPSAESVCPRCHTAKYYRFTLIAAQAQQGCSNRYRPQNLDVDLLRAAANEGAPASAGSVLALIDRLERAEATINDPRLAGLELDRKMASIGLEGASCQAIAEAFAEQFRRADAPNYVEMHFDHDDSEIGPLVVTVQRVNGKTPHQLRTEAEEAASHAHNAAVESAARLADEEGAMTTRGPLSSAIRAMKIPSFESIPDGSST